MSLVAILSVTVLSLACTRATSPLLPWPREGGVIHQGVPGGIILSGLGRVIPDCPRTLSRGYQNS